MDEFWEGFIHTFRPNELEDNENFECFFHGHNKSYPINDLKRDLYGAVLDVSRYLRNNLSPLNILMSDSKTYNDADNTYYGNNKSLIRNIKENEKIEWIDLIENADFKNDYKLVCIPKEYQSPYNHPFYLIEKKESPVNVYLVNDKVILYWGGALKIINPNTVQRIKLNYKS
jgi:hypothetical protein